MGRRTAILTSLVAVAILATAVFASAGTTHTYPVTIAISVDRAAGKIRGEVISDAPAQFCEMSAVRVRRVMRGKDKVVARIHPGDLSTWSMRSRRPLRGKRVYAETSTYRLPDRPVVCKAARSRTVTAP